jgi:signal transduction histidine kinase
MLVVVAGALLVTAPVARVPLANTEMFLPAYAAAIFLNELITAVLLLALFSVQRSRAVLVLSIGYLFSGLMVVPWALTFPGVFASLGLPEPGLQSTASIATLRRLGFPLFVLAYALLKNADPSVRNSHAPVRGTILRSVAGVVTIACGFTWLIVTGDDALPRFMSDTRNVSELWQYVPATAVFLYLTGLTVLWRRQRSMLDFWLIIVLCTLLIELIHLSYLSAGIRLSVGWWAGRLYGLTSASLVLLVLLSQTTTLYARLARSVSAERRAREDRLVTMEALSALIAHEVNQPVASMVTNADAGLRWLGRKSPDLEETRAALKRIVSDGHRAGNVIQGIKTMFKKSAQERVPLNLNQLISDVLKRSQGEVQLGRASVEAELDEQLPLTTGNPIQLQQVVSNLISNAIEAMSSVTDRPRVLRVRSERYAPGSVLVSVGDSGIGLDPEHKDQIFDPFFTTNRDGMGMGLMFCRSIIEAHGGRLWATDNDPHGAIFQLILPHNEDSALPNKGQLR